MNGPIARLFAVIVVLFGLLIVWTSRWTVIDSKALQNNTLNARTLIDEEKIERGRLLADNGDVLAKSVPARGGTWNAHRTRPGRCSLRRSATRSPAAESAAAGSSAPRVVAARRPDRAELDLRSVRRLDPGRRRCVHDA